MITELPLEILSVIGQYLFSYPIAYFRWILTCNSIYKHLPGKISVPLKPILRLYGKFGLKAYISDEERHSYWDSIDRALEAGRGSLSLEYCEFLFENGRYKPFLDWLVYTPVPVAKHFLRAYEGHAVFNDETCIYEYSVRLKCPVRFQRMVDVFDGEGYEFYDNNGLFCCLDSFQDDPEAFRSEYLEVDGVPIKYSDTHMDQLLDAALCGHPKIARLAIEIGANPAKPDLLPKRMQSACASGIWEMIQVFRSHGANIDIPAAVSRGSKCTADVFSKILNLPSEDIKSYYNGLTLVDLAMIPQTDCLEKIELLFKRGVPYNSNWHTKILSMSKGGAITGITKLMLSLGAEIDDADSWFDRTLCRLVSDWDVVELLILFSRKYPGRIINIKHRISPDKFQRIRHRGELVEFANEHLAGQELFDPV